MAQTTIAQLVEDLLALAAESPLGGSTPVLINDSPRGENYIVNGVDLDDEFIFVRLESDLFPVDIVTFSRWEGKEW